MFATKSFSDPSQSLADLLAHPEQRLLFEQFCFNRFALESIHFVQDVAEYKRYFCTGKASNWKLQKARHIFATYVEVGSCQEINISFEVRTRMRKEISEAGNSWRDDHLVQRLKCAFDPAVLDIERSILRPLFLEFLHLQEGIQKEVTTGSNSTNYNGLNKTASLLLSSFKRRSRSMSLQLELSKKEDEVEGPESLRFGASFRMSPLRRSKSSNLSSISSTGSSTGNLLSLS